MFFRKNKLRVEVLEYIDKKLCVWNNDSILLHITGSNESLKFNMNNNTEIVNYQLMLNNKPLYNIHGDNYYCPTCQKIIEEGYGFSDSNRFITEQVIKAQSDNLTLRESKELLIPLLGMLQEGLYLLTRVSMYPVDGEGNFFWNSTNKRRKYVGSADMYYHFHYGNGYPSFLYPSQSLSSFNIDTVNNYRNEILRGVNMTGLAVYMDGFMSLLLDGHHRSAAACLEGKQVECLTLVRVNNHALSKEGIVNFFAGGEVFYLRDMKNSKRISKLLPKYKLSNYPIDNSGYLYGISNSDINKKISIELSKKAKMFPVCREIAFDTMVDDISFERLEFLWDKYDHESCFEFEILIDVLYRRSKDDMFEYLVKIVKDINKKDFWGQCYKLLVNYPDEHIEDILVEYLVKYEYDKYDEVRKIIDDYYKQKTTDNIT